MEIVLYGHYTESPTYDGDPSLRRGVTRMLHQVETQQKITLYVRPFDKTLEFHRFEIA